MDNTTALLVIDMQNGLLKKIKHNRYILINHVNSLIDFFHKKDRPVYFIQHSNKITLRAYQEAWMLSEQLHSLSKDKIIAKKHSSIWKEKTFLKILDEEQIKTIVVVGLASNGCVKAACMDAIAKGISVILIGDAHSNFKKDTDQVIANWNEQLEYEGSRIIKTEDFIKDEIADNTLRTNEDTYDCSNKVEDKVNIVKERKVNEIYNIEEIKVSGTYNNEQIKVSEIYNIEPIKVSESFNKQLIKDDVEAEESDLETSKDQSLEYISLSKN